MKNYENPKVVMTEDLAEGVFAASGASGITWTKGNSEKKEYDGGSSKLNQDFNITVTGDPSGYSQIKFVFSCELKYVWGEPLGKLEGSGTNTYYWNLSKGNPSVITAQSYYDQYPVIDIVSAEFV